MEGVQYRIGWLAGGLMLGLAVVADLLQILFTLVVVLAPASDIVTIIAEGGIVFYFFIRGVHFLKGKGSTGRIVGLIVTSVIEMIPFLDALPTLTFDTWYNIHSSRKADREEYKEKQEQLAAETAAQAAQEEQQVRAYLHYQAANDNEVEEEYQEAA